MADPYSTNLICDQYPAPDLNLVEKYIKQEEDVKTSFYTIASGQCSELEKRNLFPMQTIQETFIVCIFHVYGSSTCFLQESMHSFHVYFPITVLYGLIFTLAA